MTKTDPHQLGRMVAQVVAAHYRAGARGRLGQKLFNALFTNTGVWPELYYETDDNQAVAMVYGWVYGNEEGPRAPEEAA